MGKHSDKEKYYVFVGHPVLAEKHASLYDIPYVRDGIDIPDADILIVSDRECPAAKARKDVAKL